MSRITVIGGTGYAGSAIVAEAASRGHVVTVVSRSTPDSRVDGVLYVGGSAFDADVLDRAFDGADAIVSSTSPRGDMATRQVGLTMQLAERAGAAGIPIIVVGGYSSLRPAPGEPRFIEGDVNPAILDEAQAGHDTLTALQSSSEAIDWVFVSPAARFGSWAPGERTGNYRLGGEVSLVDAHGVSAISGEDFAIAIVDLIESGEHHREHVSVAY